MARHFPHEVSPTGMGERKTSVIMSPNNSKIVGVHILEQLGQEGISAQEVHSAPCVSNGLK